MAETEPELPAEPAAPEREPAAEQGLEAPSSTEAAAPLPATRPVPRAGRAPPPTMPETIRYALDAVVASGTDLRVLSIAVAVFAAAVIGAPLGAEFLYTVYASALSEPGADVTQESLQLLSILTIPALVAGLVAFVAFILVFVQVPLYVVATVGGRIAGQPVTLREALRRARQLFWRGLGAIVLIDIASATPTGIARTFIDQTLGPTSLALGLDVLAGAVFASPWVYVLPGIVLGGVGVGEAMRRSWALARFRWRLALTIAFLAVVGQVIVAVAALGTLGVVFTVGGVAHPQLEVPASAEPVLGFAAFLVGTAFVAGIWFAVQAVQFAPQASGFYALTRYAAGLDAARSAIAEPLFRRRALIFYGVGVASAVLIALELLGRTPLS